MAGEFGRTPRITYQASSGGGVASGAAGVMQLGRDHWPHATSLLISGGGTRPGQVIGATDRQGAEVTRRRVGVRDLLATLYHHLGIDPRHEFRDAAGRPVPILWDGRPIADLI